MRIKLNLPGFTATRRSPEVVAAVNKAAEDLAQTATGLARIKGAVYQASPAQASDYGVIALVSARSRDSGRTRTSGKAAADEARYATLEKAVGGVGA